VSTPPRVAHVLNDAILLAARDAFQTPTGSAEDHLRNQRRARAGLDCQLCGHFKSAADAKHHRVRGRRRRRAIPVYDRLQRIHLPKTTKVLGYSDILPKYVNATGGGTVHGELTEADIERAYSKAMAMRAISTRWATPASGVLAATARSRSRCGARA